MTPNNYNLFTHCQSFLGQPPYQQPYQPLQFYTSTYYSNAQPLPYVQPLQLQPAPPPPPNT